MKTYWKSHGLTEKGAEKAEAVLDLMKVAVDKAGSEQLADIVFKEAVFQIFELKTRDPQFVEKYLNGS